MHKRLFAVLMIAALVIGMMLVACGGSETKPKTASPDSAKTGETFFADDFSGVYVSDKLFLRVTKRTDSSYDIVAIQGTYNEPQITWEMTGSLENTVEINYTDCIKTDYTSSKDGEVKYTKGTGQLTFTANSLSWRDDQEKIGDGLTFEMR